MTRELSRRRSCARPLSRSCRVAPSVLVVIPYKSDTEPPSFAWGTIGLIAANVAVALLLGFPSESAFAPGDGSFVDSWVLAFGTINPLTWVSSAFVHFDWFHLVSNMIFLWAFGFIVEGYLGWRRLLLLYLAVVAAQGCLWQVILFGADGGWAAGASGGIYSLMAIAALWAPRNKLTLFVWFVVIIRNSVQVSLLGFCAFWVGLDLLTSLFVGFELSSELLHVMGAAVGLAAGVLMLKKGWVDTGGWDYLSIRKSGEPRFRLEKPETQSAPVSPAVRTLVAVRQALADGDAVRAAVALRDGPADFQLPADDRDELIRALVEAGRPELALPHVEASVRSSPRAADLLRFATMLLDARQPSHAMEQLDRLPADALDAAQQRLHAGLAQRARAMLDSGRLELE